MRIIDSIVIHCSDSKDDDPETGKIEGDFGVDTIESWHAERAKTEPWTHYVDHNGNIKYIGYHYVMRKNGMWELGRPVSEVGCHCKGKNKNSIGVCWVGSKVMNSKQKSALVALTAQLCVDHALGPKDVYGHCQFSTKTCPNFDSVSTFESMDEFRTLIELAMRQIK